MNGQLEARLKELQSFEPDVSEGILPPTDYACNVARILFDALHLRNENVGVFPNTDYPGGLFIESLAMANRNVVMIDILPTENPDVGNGYLYAFRSGN